MKLLYIHIEEDYKHIKAGGYYFDREFIVKKFNPKISNRKIVLERNTKYHHPFNENLNNIACIVGKNGIGKTTFFELVIAPLLWRLDGNFLEDKIHLLFYDEIMKEFYIQSYTTTSNGWKIYLKRNKRLKRVKLYKNKKNDPEKINIMSNSKYRSVLPYQLNIIFHSLSPFDRIYDLLKRQLFNASSGQVEHYRKRLKYVGIKQIEKNETIYEYMTIINLISILIDKKLSLMFRNLGYEFGNIEIEINDDEIELKLPEFKQLSKNKLVQTLFTEDTYKKLEEKLIYKSYGSKINEEEFFNDLILKNIKINTPTKFIQLLIYMNDKYNLTPDNIIDNINEFLCYLEKPSEVKHLFRDNDYIFLKDIFKYKNKLIEIKNLNNNMYLEKMIEDNTFLDFLKIIKKLANRNYLDFKMYLLKNDEPFDFFRLSSGEKTLLSYFANILGRVRELDEIQAQNNTYSNLKNKSYLILIDEVELHLHPEWQRNFIKQLNDFFTYEDKSKKFQFVIATHSPFVVSDIYDENIIYLGNEKMDSKTFGGNIFDIFKDDFYVSNTIGSFSEEIIKELSEVLYVLFALKKAENEQNYFMLRDFFDLMYETDNKEEENQILLKDLNSYIFDFEENKKFKNIENNKYLENIRNSKEKFYKEIVLIINNIGEDVVREHLQKMYDYIREENA